MTKNSVKKSVFYFTVLAVLSKGFGFIREQFIAYGYGADYSIDAYAVSLLIPTMIFSIVGSALTTAMLPLITEQYAKEGKEKAFDFINNVINILIIISTIIFFVGRNNIGVLVKIVAPSFGEEAFNLTVQLAKITMINIIFLTLSNVLITTLQSLDEFAPSNLVNIPISVLIVAYIMLWPKLTVQGLIIATMIGNFLRCIIPIPWLLKHGYRYKLIMKFNDDRFKSLLKLLLPVVFAIIVNQINILVENNMASALPQGSIAILGYSAKVSDIIFGLFSTSIVTVIYPVLSRVVLECDDNKTSDLLSKTLNYHSLLIFPLVAIIASNSLPLVNILFKRGKFDDYAAVLTSKVIIYGMISTVFWGIRDILNQALYSLKLTKKVTVNSVIGVAVNILSNLILVRYLGIIGLVISALIASGITALLAFISLSRLYPNLNNLKIWKSSFQSLGASLITIIAIYFIKTITDKYGISNDILLLLFSSSLGVITYVALLFILKNEDIIMVYRESKQMFYDKAFIKLIAAFNTYYIYRIDDITPHMNWENFWKVIMIFKKHNVVPIIGVVPNNKDKDLNYGGKKDYFWKILKYMQENHIVEIAQHGYTHEVILKSEGIFKEKFGYNKTSEFAGLTYEEQLIKIKAGKDIFLMHGIEVDTFMAPCHSFDHTTLKVLKSLGFKYVTDGIGLTPYKVKNLVFVPQQFGKPRNFFYGVITLCLHLNYSSAEEIQQIEKHVESNKNNFIRFSEAVNMKERKLPNMIFKAVYLFLRYSKYSIKRHKNKIRKH